ncbi:hypothetical protein MSG28_011544 [Choristoneura fumiferana]|uniref:Uncharacterized protein n=1 Tax=Choristoneura fumiferana TaxID=7141 RepID=A0ACC0JP39_CHOFU|nr:hypothetical protein MSG28_011544 [Choristoneura fumiferana]
MTLKNNANYNYDDDNVVPNTPDDDVVRNTSVIEVEILPQDLFSWEKTDVILADDTEVVLDETVDPPEVTLDFGDVSMYNDEQPTKDDTGEKVFRYTCVQCVDWDLCAACEAHATHDTHYVLRVPGQRPYVSVFRYTRVQYTVPTSTIQIAPFALLNLYFCLQKEMQAVLAAIRLQMLREDLFLPGTIASIKEEVKDEDSEVPESAPQVEADPLAAWDISQHDDDCSTLEVNTVAIKEEVKDEDSEVPESAPQVEADPLAAWDISQHDDDCSTLEIYPERKDEDGGPSRKRRTSVDSLDNTQNLTSHGNDDSSYNGLATMADDVRMESNTDGDTCPNFDYSEPIEIIDIDKLIKTHEQTESTKTNYNDTLQITKEFCTVMSHRDSILDPCKPKLQDNKREKLIDISIDITHQKTINLNSHTKDDTHRIITHSKETGTDAKGIEAPNEAIARPTKETGRHSDLTRALSQRRKGIDSKVIRSRNISNTNDKTKKRYKILLPPGAQWKQLLMTMLKSRVTVPLEDVMRKEQVRKNTE